MPLYEHECEQCGAKGEHYATVDERRNSPACRCGGKTKLIISPVLGFVDIPAYVSPTTNRVISSRSARRDDLARSNCRPWEGKEQEVKEAARHRAYEEQAQDKKLDEAAHRAFHELPPEKRRVLEDN